MKGPPGEDTPGLMENSGRFGIDIVAVERSDGSGGRGEPRVLAVPVAPRSGLEGRDGKGDWEGSGLW